MDLDYELVAATIINSHGHKPQYKLCTLVSRSTQITCVISN